MSFGNLLSRLLKQRGFTLQKISPTTFPPDVITTHRRSPFPLSDKEAEGILDLVKSGSCFRCRIGKGRYFYGSTVSDAIEMALEAKAAK